MSTGAPTSDDSFEGGAPTPAAETPPRAPSPGGDSWDVHESPTVDPAEVALVRYPSPIYDFTDNSLHTLYLEHDFHQMAIVCGDASISLPEVFDTTSMKLQIGFAAHLRETMLDALGNSFILNPSERASPRRSSGINMNSTTC